MDISYLDLLALDVLKIVLDVHQRINVSIVKTASSYMEDPAIHHAHREQLLIHKHSNVSLVTVHAEPVQIIQVHALVVNQEKDIYK